MALTVVTLLVSYRYQKVKAQRDLNALQERLTTLHSMEEECTKIDERYAATDILITALHYTLIMLQTQRRAVHARRRGREEVGRNSRGT